MQKKGKNTEVIAKKENMRPFSMKWNEEDKDKLERIMHEMNVDSHASAIRKLIRDYKLHDDR